MILLDQCWEVSAAMIEFPFVLYFDHEQFFILLGLKLRTKLIPSQYARIFFLLESIFISSRHYLGSLIQSLTELVKPTP
jgi:hypothetical protein